MGRFAGTILLAAAASAAPAHAQDHASWAVVVVTSSDDPARDAVVADSVYAQLDVTGHALVADERLAAALDTTLSVPPRDAPHALVARLASGTSDVVHLVAAGHDAPALEAGRALLAEAEASLPALGRDESSAENVRNLCLFLVRAYADQHRRDEARAMATECVRLAPDLAEPSPHWHPPEIVALFRSARAALAAPGHATLVVQTAPGDPPDCVVRVGGRPVGTAPLQLAVAAGSHQVQVECRENRPSRVHRVDVVPASATHVVVTARFDEVLRSAPRAALVYDDEDSLGRYLTEDVARVGRAASLAHVVVVRDDDGRVFLRHFLVPESGDARSLGSSLVERPTDAESLRASVDAITSGVAAEAEPVTTAAAPHAGGPRSSNDAAPALPSTVGERSPTVAGVAVGISGALGLAAGWGFWAWLQVATRDFAAAPVTHPSYLALQSQMNAATVATVTAGLAGGLLLAVSLPWSLPEESGTPWWAWVAGALGLGGAGAAVAFALIPAHDQNGATAAIFASVAAPLLAVPIVYLARGSSPRDVTARVTAGPGGLAVSGTW